MQCTSLDCSEKAVFHLSWIENRRCARQAHLCEEHAREAMTPVAFTAPSSPFNGHRAQLEYAKQFEIGLIVISEIHDQQVVYLYEVGGTRVFPLLVGIFEATSLDRNLKGYPSPRPLTHDAFAAAIRLMGGELQRVVIHRFETHIHYAEAGIRANGRLLQLDIRPSDAFTLAVIFDCPIFVADRVLEQIGL